MQPYAVPKLRYIDFTTMVMEDKMRIYFGIKNSYDLNMWQILTIFRREAFFTYIALAWVLAACLAVIYHIDGELSVGSGLLFSVASVGNTLILKHFDATVSTSRAKKILFIFMGVLATIMFDYIRAGSLIFYLIKVGNIYLEINV